MIGLLLSSLAPPTTASAILIWYLASSFWYVEPVVKCFSQFSRDAKNSWTVCACFGTSSGVTSGLYMCIIGR